MNGHMSNDEEKRGSKKNDQERKKTYKDIYIYTYKEYTKEGI